MSGEVSGTGSAEPMRKVSGEVPDRLPTPGRDIRSPYSEPLLQKPDLRRVVEDLGRSRIRLG